MTDQSNNGEKIEDILKSVRNIIDNHNNKISPSQTTTTKNAASNAATSQKEVPFKEEILKNEQTSDTDNILELTSVIEEKDIGDCLISDQVKQQTKEEINKFINVFKEEYSGKYQSMELIVNDLMRPLIKDWLNNNLPNIVERIVSEEIKKIIPK